MEPKRIVVADHETWVRQYYFSELERRGYQVSLAARGEEVLRRVRDDDPHVVILDLRLPPRGGLETLNDLLIHLPRPPAVVLTSWSCFCDEGYLVWMADDCFVKSEGPAALVARIEKALERKAARDPGMGLAPPPGKPAAANARGRSEGTEEKDGLGRREMDLE